MKLKRKAIDQQKYFEGLADQLDNFPNQDFALWYLLKNHLLPDLQKEYREIFNSEFEEPKTVEEFKTKQYMTNLYREANNMIDCLYYRIWG